MYENLLVPGLQVEISIPALDVVAVKNKIYEVTDSELRLYAPTQDGTVIRIPTRCPIVSTFISGRRKFRFKSIVLDIRLQPLPTMVIARPIKISNIELRQFYRLPKLLNVHFRDIGGREYEGYTINVSGNGLLLAAKVDFYVGDVLDITLHLDNDEDFCFRGEIVREDVKETHRNLYGVQIINMSKEKRQSLIKYIFQAQSEMRRKGKL